VGQVDDWIGYASSFGVGAEFEGACAYANSYLTLRTFLVGNDLSIADITVVAYLAGTFMLLSETPIVRWYSLIILVVIT
jgi:glutamyl-tRNA synthetase